MARSSTIERACQAIAGVGILALVGIAARLPSWWVEGTPFLFTATGAWALTIHQLWRHRDEAGTNGLGAATSVTLLRAWLVAIVAGHLLLTPVAGTRAFVVGIIYSIAAILDSVDGRIARGQAHVTRLGSRLDVATDALGLLVAPIVAVRSQGLPPWYLMLALAHPVMRLALAVRARLGMPVFPERLRPNPRARFFAGVQMGVVATSLFLVLPRWLVWTAATLAMLPTLALFLQEWRLAIEAHPSQGATRAQAPSPGR
jgi:CDP-diacylglycerol--glycerol-3-phosphate 3-phosphatidyltransferase